MITLFGKPHEVLGSSNSDLILKCKGQIKVQWGQKYIDLLKDGKLNVNTKFIYKGNEVGTKTGIYVIDSEDDTQDVYVVIDGLQIKIKDSTSTTYVSFLEEQTTTSENKETALHNIGFLYENVNAVDSESVKNGIVYIKDELKLYTVIDGQLKEYSIKSSNNFNESLIISAGGLKLIGENNGLILDGLLIYTTKETAFVDSTLPIKFKINGKDLLLISVDGFTFDSTITAQSFKTKDATGSKGLTITTNPSGQATLTVDSLVVRNADSEDNYEYIPEKWETTYNIITGSADSEEESIVYNLAWNNTFQENDLLICYPIVEESEESEEVSYVLKVTKSSDSTIEVEYIIPENSTELPNNTYVYKISGTPIRIKENNIDIVSTVLEENSTLTETIEARYGNLTDIGGTGSGIYAKYGLFDNASYINDLPLEDDSNNFASTKWVKQQIQPTLPIGSIIMYNGEIDDIPEDWAICNGENGTPDLRNLFIMASDNEKGPIQTERDWIFSDTTNMTSHMYDIDYIDNINSWLITVPHYKLIFIMKIK